MPHDIPIQPWQQFASLHWHPIPSGQSGASVWRGELAGTPLMVLKRYPTHMTVQRLQSIHSVMASARTSLGSLIPNVSRTSGGESFAVADGHLCDVQSWMNGEPGRSKDVAAGLQAIRRLHHAIGQQHTELSPAPGIEARLQVLGSWNTTDARAVVDELRPWQHVTRRCHIIHGDLHREHLLFQNGHAAGFIDFVAARIDDPLLDVARWLGDVGSPEHLHLWGEDMDLLKVLIRASLLCALLHWRTNPQHPRAIQVRKAWELFRA